MTRTPIVRVIWHPHQRLWNWQLEHRLRKAGRRFGLDRALVAALINLDSLLLLTPIVARRILRYGPWAALRLERAQARVLYLDCGLHTRGEQVRFVHKWFGDRWILQTVGIDASDTHCREARRHLAGLRSVEVRHAALVGPGHRGETAALFKHAASGRDATLILPSAVVEMVPAARLSDILLSELAPPFDDALVIVRMNIEGSEAAVIEDLVTRGLHTRVCGWFGMWDDVGKQSQERDRRFRRELVEAGIRTVTFNDRDMAHPARRLAIRLAIDDALRRGLEARAARTRENAVS